MNTLNVIPAIDLIGGKCVRLTQGDYARSKVYEEDPLVAATAFQAAGARRLHLVDLDGAKAAAPVNLEVLRRIVRETGLAVEFGGGIKSETSLEAVLEAGASFAICGSIAVTDPDTFSRWLDRYGERIILGLDLRDGCVATRGWLDTSSLTAEDVLNRFGGRVRQAIVTEIARDGTLQGVDTAFYRRLQDAFPGVDIIVSGGVAGLADLEACAAAGLRAAVVGKAFYEGRIDLKKVFRGGDGAC